KFRSRLYKRYKGETGLDPWKNDNMNKALTPGYLEWEAKLELPSILSDKSRSRFYKRYKNKTGLYPWINSETSESSQTEIDETDLKLMDKITELEKENIKIKGENVELKRNIDELKKELESKKNRKFQEKCILIAQVLLGEEPVVEYRPSFMERLELDAFFRSNRIALEVQGAQHRLHNTSWYKDVKKLEDIVNRDRKKRCMCQDNGIFLLEIWYDENPEIVIPKRIQKIRGFVNESICKL
ncbi:7953_t:CDS:1, partial [Diversispora eburnea]